MFSFRRTSGIVIPSQYRDMEFYAKVKEFLERRIKDYQTSVYSFYKFYVEARNALVIPRYFPIRDFVVCNIEDDIDLGEDIKISDNIKPRTELQKNAMKYLLGNKNGILRLDPGSGKTVISIKAVSELKKKTIILVHRDSLVQQWIGPGEREPQGFLAFTSLKEDEISRVTSKNYKEALQKSVSVITDQTFISLLKRQKVEFIRALRDANFGIFFADEVHTTVGAPTFAECSIYIPTYRCFGLSATPYRWDGNTDIINFHLGDTYEDKSDSGTMGTRVTFILIDYGIMEKSAKYVMWAGQFQRARYLNLIKKSKPAMNLFKSLLLKFKNDRDIIFVSERIKLIEELFKWTPIESKSKFISNTTNKALQAKVVFATPGKIRDGVDIPKKDCLIMTSPISNIHQMVGRIVRTSAGKQKPIVVDIVDIGCNDIANTMFNRIKYYKEKNWPIQYILAMRDGSLKSISENDVSILIRGE